MYRKAKEKHYLPDVSNVQLISKSNQLRRAWCRENNLRPNLSIKTKHDSKYQSPLSRRGSQRRCQVAVAAALSRRGSNHSPLPRRGSQCRCQIAVAITPLSRRGSQSPLSRRGSNRSPLSCVAALLFSLTLPQYSTTAENVVPDSML